MARGKFNKRGGGKRLDAHNADEIEQRNQRLAEFEETRSKRRAEEEEAQNGGADDNEGSEEKVNPKAGDGGKDKGPSPPVQVTSAEDHRKNISKLDKVRKRREQAEARRKSEQEADLSQEMERISRLKKIEDANSNDDGKKKKKSKEKEIPKLTRIEIKKMKPTQMKDGK